jgi:4,5-DOPA dioxygenase extradiol
MFLIEMMLIRIMNRRTFIGLSLSTGTMIGINEWLKLKDNVTSEDIEMPVLFVGHGSPMNALEDNKYSREWRRIAAKIPVPKAILCISAHWLTKGSFITAMDKPKTIHDFGGFPRELFEVEYPAPGYPALAEKTKQMMSEIELGLDYQWGFDHGSWSVTRQMYPEANIPMLQLSIDYHKPSDYHYKLAKALAPLRRQGVLIIGSGNIIHNLGIMDFSMKEGGYDWAIELNEQIRKNLLDKNHHYFLHYQKIGKAANLAIPTPDHFYPLLYILGLQNQKETQEIFNDSLIGGSISMTGLKIG